MVDSVFLMNTILNMVMGKIKPHLPDDICNIDLVKALYVMKYYNNVKRIDSGDFELKGKLENDEINSLNIVKKVYESSL